MTGTALLRERTSETRETKEMATIDSSKADIALLGLTPRSQRCLRESGITTIGQLAKMNMTELAGLNDIGPSALAEISDKLADAGIILPPEPSQAGEHRARVRSIRPEVSRRVGRNIRRIRESQGIGRQTLAWKMHEHGFLISVVVLKNIELGMPGEARRPRWVTVDELAGFAEVLGVSYDELLKE